MINNIGNLEEQIGNAEVVEVVFNNTKTTLYRVGGDRWVGRPVDASTGKVCAFGLSINSKGLVGGTAALNFIVMGGWKPGTKKPSFQKRSETRECLVRLFFSACLLYSKSEGAIEKRLEEELGHKCAPFNWSQSPGEDVVKMKETLAMVGITTTQAMALEANNLTLEVDVASVAAKYVSPTYAACKGGMWDEESADVAITSALPLSVQRLMESNGLRFVKVRRKSITK